MRHIALLFTFLFQFLSVLVNYESAGLQFTNFNQIETLSHSVHTNKEHNLESFASDKILLSEVARDNEFIEIYNPNNHSVDLSDYYLTDGTYQPLDVYYYNIVGSSNPGGGGFFDFHARFPDGATIPAGAYQTISMLGSANFMQAYNQLPTYELIEDDTTSDAIPDMRTAFAGSIDTLNILSNSGEVVILYKWDGESDLVQDVDYIVWGDKAEAVDKTGASIDGPDADMINSTYSDDTPVTSQEVPTEVVFGLGLSYHRIDYTEGTQSMSGGNGITGADETSENFSATWTTLTVPTPNAGEECNTTITLDYELATAQYNADMTINALGAVIGNNKDVIFAYGQEIILGDDFLIENGSTLTTLFQSCK